MCIYIYTVYIYISGNTKTEETFEIKNFKSTTACFAKNGSPDGILFK